MSANMYASMIIDGVDQAKTNYLISTLSANKYESTIDGMTRQRLCCNISTISANKYESIILYWMDQAKTIMPHFYSI